MAVEKLQGIKNIIIDMGGVILDIDHRLTADAFRQLGVTEFERLFTKAMQSGFIEAFECGKLSPAEFRNEIRKLGEINFSDTEIDTAWNSLILDLKWSRVAALRALSQRYNLYLLSNNNAIHFEQCIKKIEALLPFTEFSALFKKSYYSHLIGMQKPDKAAFELVINENQLNIKETLFWDDSEQHIASAQQLGLGTILISTALTIEQLV